MRFLIVKFIKNLKYIPFYSDEKNTKSIELKIYKSKGKRTL